MRWTALPLKCIPGLMQESYILMWVMMADGAEGGVGVDRGNRQMMAISRPAWKDRGGQLI